MKPCYNSIALARHQHEIDRQEAKEHWIAAAVDRLMDDEEWIMSAKKEWALWTFIALKDFLMSKAKEQANREYQQHLSALEQARIDDMVSE